MLNQLLKWKMLLNGIKLIRMKYRIENQLLIDNPTYGALGDDFSFKEIEAIELIIEKIEAVINGQSEVETIYGNMCYHIILSAERSSIYCYDELLGEEPTDIIYTMFKEYKNSLI